MVERKFELSEPLTTHSGVVRELTLRTPTAKVYLKHGAIVTYATSQETRRGDVVSTTVTGNVNYNALFGYISDMTGIDQVVLSGLSAMDVGPLLEEVQAVIMRPLPQKTSSQSADSSSST